MKNMKSLECCCCGRGTKGRQWWNRDKGYGLCPSCAEQKKGYETKEQMEFSYGYEGVHYMKGGSNGEVAHRDKG